MVEEIRLWGLVVRFDLKWTYNTEEMIKKACKKLWALGMGANVLDLKDIYIKQVRCIVELAVAAWNGALTKREQIDIERVQKTALHVMLGGLYQSYGDALDLVGLETLDARRQNLCLKFAQKCPISYLIRLLRSDSK